MKKMIVLKGVVACALLPTAGGTAALARGTGDAAPTVHVRYADLNLATSEGAATLQRRVKFAIDNTLCPMDSAPMELSRVALVKKCRQNARAGSVQQIAAVLDAHRNPAANQLAGLTGDH